MAGVVACEHVQFSVNGCMPISCRHHDYEGLLAISLRDISSVVASLQTVIVTSVCVRCRRTSVRLVSSILFTLSSAASTAVCSATAMPESVGLRYPFIGAGLGVDKWRNCSINFLLRLCRKYIQNENTDQLLADVSFWPSSHPNGTRSH